MFAALSGNGECRHVSSISHMVRAAPSRSKSRRGLDFDDCGVAAGNCDYSRRQEHRQPPA